VVSGEGLYWRHSSTNGGNWRKFKAAVKELSLIRKCLSQFSYVHCRVSQIFPNNLLRNLSFVTHIFWFLFPIDGCQDVKVLVDFGCFVPTKMRKQLQPKGFLFPQLMETPELSNFKCGIHYLPPYTMELMGLHTTWKHPVRTRIWHLQIGFSPNEIKRKQETQHLCFSARNVWVKFVARFRGKTNGARKRTPAIAAFFGRTLQLGGGFNSFETYACQNGNVSPISPNWGDNEKIIIETTT